MRFHNILNQKNAELQKTHYQAILFGNARKSNEPVDSIHLLPIWQPEKIGLIEGNQTNCLC